MHGLGWCGQPHTHAAVWQDKPQTKRTQGQLHLPAAAERADRRGLQLRREAHRRQHLDHLRKKDIWLGRTSMLRTALRQEVCSCGVKLTEASTSIVTCDVVAAKNGWGASCTTQLAAHCSPVQFPKSHRQNPPARARAWSPPAPPCQPPQSPPLPWSSLHSRSMGSWRGEAFKTGLQPKRVLATTKSRGALSGNGGQEALQARRRRAA